MVLFLAACSSGLLTPDAPREFGAGVSHFNRLDPHRDLETPDLVLQPNHVQGRICNFLQLVIKVHYI